MVPIALILSPELADFYGKIAQASGLSLTQVLEDALFKLAGELSLEALHRQSPIS